MGTRCCFVCPGCGYSANVSGGDDAGMFCETTTMVCRGCRSLYDIKTRIRPLIRMRVDWVAQKPRCPESDEHELENWTHPGPCPRCNAIMEKDESVIEVWD